jgi:hypothetical protein
MAAFVCEYRKPRSTDATGNDPDDLHEYFLGEWGGWETISVMSRKRLVPIRRSSKLSTVEFSEFYAFIQQRAAEKVGIFIPDPDPTTGGIKRQHEPAHKQRAAHWLTVGCACPVSVAPAF